MAHGVGLDVEAAARGMFDFVQGVGAIQLFEKTTATVIFIDSPDKNWSRGMPGNSPCKVGTCDSGSFPLYLIVAVAGDWAAPNAKSASLHATYRTLPTA